MYFAFHNCSALLGYQTVKLTADDAPVSVI